MRRRGRGDERRARGRARRRPGRGGLHRRPELPSAERAGAGPLQGGGVCRRASRRCARAGAWWRIYRDPVLDRLEQQVAVSNQNLKAAAAAFREAEALVAEARAGFFPTLSASAQGQRARSAGVIANLFSQSVSASWVPDLWGRVRRTVEGQLAGAQASAAELANARLSAQA